MDVSTACDISSQNKPRKRSCLERLSNGFISLLERAFYRLGYVVASHPYLTICQCVLICGLCAIGMKDFKETNAAEKLWVPATSRIQDEKRWVMKNFPPFTRYASVILTADNVLSPASLRAMMAFYKSANTLESGPHYLQTMCFRVGPVCHVTSILELWFYNEELINSLTQDDIIQKINNVTMSPMYHSKLHLGSLLGQMWRDSSGQIVGAKAASMLFLLYDKPEWKKPAMDWELKMVNLAKSGHSDLTDIFIYTTRSFDDEGYGAVNADVNLLSTGFSLVMVYLILTLGRFNLVHQKFYLSIAGLLSVGLAIGFAYGLAITCGVLYGPVHALMPFLLLGIGVDDMFVIVEAWKNLTPKELKLPLVDRMALSLKHAGVSITVTSITDVVAFAIGASTVIPGLSGFCIYAALGILALYGLQATFFVACLTLDQRKVEATRDGCIPCYVHKNYTPNSFSQWNIMTTAFEKYVGPNLMKFPIKVLVLLVTSALLGVNVWGFYHLKQDFSLTMYIPSDSYAHKYAMAREKYFPSDGLDTAVYCKDFEYHKSRDLMEKMYSNIVEDPYIVNGSVVFWFSAFNDWFDRMRDDPSVAPSMYGDVKYPYSKAWFALLVHRFLYHTPQGQAYRQFIKFENASSTGNPIIRGTYFKLRHTYQPDSKSEIIAMEHLRHIIDNSGLPGGGCFAYTDVYLTYETNKILQRELYRNLLLAVICVFTVTLLLIANFRTSLIVFTCVIFTLVDVAGTLHFWGVTIDTASSILLTLSVGLAVDYSAHIGHMFMTVQGTRPERVVETLKKIGPAVFSGGFSTFLAFLLLCNSYSYGFSLFFRVFFTVVLFGLFHGLIYLPVVLSWIGPEPYDTHLTTEDRANIYIPQCKCNSQGESNHLEPSTQKPTLRESTDQEALWVPQEDLVDKKEQDLTTVDTANAPLLDDSSKDMTTQQDHPSSQIPFTSIQPSHNITTDTSPLQQEKQELINGDTCPLLQERRTDIIPTSSGEKEKKMTSMVSPWIVKGSEITLAPSMDVTGSRNKTDTSRGSPTGPTQTVPHPTPVTQELSTVPSKPPTIKTNRQPPHTVTVAQNLQLDHTRTPPSTVSKATSDATTPDSGIHNGLDIPAVKTEMLNSPWIVDGSQLILVPGWGASTDPSTKNKKHQESMTGQRKQTSSVMDSTRKSLSEADR
ncbi:patched domain-containing protein 3-like isoform X3 [Pecten maximus]|uniref:patched domain-containing protein 3-like isoform X3 n=1 Tax=Pecten maximus TaxID=6579 RepID=UPI001458DC5C|nr:patched domain-containing protein 3-like isoform X3 [Pecten maximus]